MVDDGFGQLHVGELTITGRIRTASNATFVGLIGETVVVYKPLAGEKPLWDFPDGDLASREVSAYLVSQVFGGTVVPLTWLRDGPLGAGMVQLWQDAELGQDAVDLVTPDEMPEGWLPVFTGMNERDQPVVLVHEDTEGLRRMAVFDVVVNNADRKGAHILAMSDGHRFGVDHGLTFHEEHKLRTVLWGWIGVELSADELAGVARVRSELDGALGEALDSLITPNELEALAARCERLMRTREFPAPHGQMPAVPWPLF